MAFAFGWFWDPLVYGKYPDEMTSLVTDGRLPTFSPDEVNLIKDSYDYIGLNTYTSGYVKNDPLSKGGNYSSDSRAIYSKEGIDG